MNEWTFPDKLDFLFDPHRYKIAYGGRGSAKSWSYARALLIQGWQDEIRILCTREIQKSIKDSVYQLLVDQISELGLNHFYDILATEIKGKNGTKFVFSGLSDHTVNSIKSFEGMDRCWVEEAHAVTKKSWDILIPTIRKEASEIWISFNPELDTDDTWVRFVEHVPESAKVVEINYRDNPWFSDILNEERLHLQRLVAKGAREQDDYDNTWEGKTRAAVEGAIYHREVTKLKSEQRLTRVPYDPMLKVHTIWDLGRRDFMCIIMAQKLGSEVRVIDYIEDSHRTIDDYIQSQEGREDLASRPYRWGKDYLPHDGKNKYIVHKKSPRQILEDLGRDVELVEDIGIEAGIKAARQLFPRTVMDKTKASLLLNRLGRYKRRMNQQTGLADAPLHDENSNGADAFRYLAVVEGDLTNEDRVISDPYAGFRHHGGLTQLP